MPEWLNIVARSLIALVSLFILTRILGKKQISQLTFFEYVLGITLGDLAGYISTDDDSHFTHGLLALSVWFIVPYALELLALKSKKMRGWFEGKGTPLIQEGKIMERNLKKERYSADELLEQLRTKSVFRVADVEFAMLEASGDLSVLLKKEHQPLTAGSLGIKQRAEKRPHTVIIDGETEFEELAAAGKSEEWLRGELDKLGLTADKVFLGQVDDNSRLFVDMYDDKLQASDPWQKHRMIALLKKCETDLEQLSATWQKEQEKQTYNQCVQRLKQAIHQLNKQI